ncbi:transposase domain-containing protein (plasmid) [Streptomyces sp. NBC_01136]|uniref:transposase domain-containing protein n=1 Tax=unclassified Streptomyces TaxID=2593676 RepID=UPI002F909F8E|nr:transposase domain-containing protein [Streptomyces sp. NBC_01136]
MSQKSVSIQSCAVTPDVYAPGHLGELTQIIDPELVDAVLEDTGARERRLRLLPARVVVYFVLAFAFFERSSYRAVWDKLTAGFDAVPVARPCASSLSRARRRLGSAPLRRLFTIVSGPVADRGQSCTFYRGLRLVAVDGTRSRPL